MSIQTPDWVKHAVFYQIFPDRFAKSDPVKKPNNLEPWDSKPTNYGFKGGDLLGIAEQLDYLQDLGVNAIYLNPILQSTANHRYHTQDYYRVDPILGGDDAFKKLLDAAHAKDIRVVIDGVFNHASRGFYQFNHALENGANSPYLDWFHIHGFPLHAYEGKHNYDAWWGNPALPKLNTDTPAVREFIFDVAEYWIKFGCDGWRLDVPAEIDDDDFWREFRQRVKAINPDAYIVGEIWHEARRWLAGDQFDAVMNYVFMKACIGFFVGEKFDHNLTSNLDPLPALDASGFAYALNSSLSMYDWQINCAQMNLLDSHDTARYLTIARNDHTALKLAALCMFTYPGAPTVYYGDEIGMAGGRDPDCRRGFPWDEKAWDSDLHGHYKACITLRNQHRALRDGGFRVVHAEGKCVAYMRDWGDEKFIVALNSGTVAAAINIVTRDLLHDGASLDVVLGKPHQYALREGQLEGLTIPKRAGVVLKVTQE